MSAVEEQLRTELEALGGSPPPGGDRVSAVRARVQRRARRRAAGAVALTVVAALGVAGLAVGPLGSGTATPAPLAAQSAEPEGGEAGRVLSAEELLVPMVQVHVDLGLPREQLDRVVDRELQAIQPPVDNHSTPRDDARVVIFTRGISPQALQGFLDGVTADAVSPDVRVSREPGTSVRFEVPLAEDLRQDFPEEFDVPPVPFELQGLLQVFAYGLIDEGRGLLLEHDGPALDQRRLDRAVELVARWAGATPEEVAVRRGQ